jgi:hypothetical protein
MIDQMEFMKVVVWGKTVKDVSIEQIGETLFTVTVGKAMTDEDWNGDLVWYVYGRSQVIVASSMYDACYKAHHLAKIIG